MERKIKKAIDGGSVTSIVFNSYAGGNGTFQVAPKLTYQDFASTEQKVVNKGKTLYVFNKSANLQWLMMTTKTDTFDAAGFGPDWFPLKPMEWTVLNSGDCQLLGKSSDDVGVYLMHDETDLK